MSTLWLPPPQVLLPAHDFPQRSSTHLPPFERDALKLPALMPSRGPSKRIFTCPYDACGKTFTVNGNLKKHIAAKHEHRKDFKCTFAGCTRRFAKKFNMMRHLNVHRSRNDKRSSSRTQALVSLPMLARACAEDWSSEEMVIAHFMADHCAEKARSSSHCFA